MKHASIFLVAVLASLHVSAEPRRERIEDPAQLHAMGFPADADNVWRLVDDDLPEAGGAFDINGIPDGYSHSMTGDDFRMGSTQSAYETDGRSYLYCPAGAIVRVASATINVPEDRRLSFFDLWGVDDSATDILHATLFATCHASDGAGPPGNTILAEVDSVGRSGGFFSTVAIPEYYTDPGRCTYAVNIALGTDGTCEDELLVLRRIRVIWAN